MPFAGEYPQPLQRTGQLLIDLVNGYTTGRLQVASLVGAGTNYGTWNSVNDWLFTGQFENTGTKAATVQLVQTPSIQSGPRTNLGSPIALQPGGRTTQTFTPTANFVEVSCTAGGPSQLRLQITGKPQLTLEGFTAGDVPDPLYPQYTIQANWPPLAW